MRLLHTADWHIGKLLCGRKRHDEHEAFLDWLLETLVEEKVEALLIAGDVFDNGAPGNYSQNLYYGFMSKLTYTACREVVVIGGNHDSPSFLDAPAGILRQLNVHVVGEARKNPADELVLLKDNHGIPQALVAAVPYLRERDLRIPQEGETWEDKERKLIEGLARHYGEVHAAAATAQTRLGGDIPLILMGHLFVGGGNLRTGDGVRDLYVGGLGQIPLDAFPSDFDYLALGHLHVPQCVGGYEWVRYSGSPIPMDFGEAGQQKSVCLLEFSGRTPSIRPIPIPVFRKVESLRGSWNEVRVAVEALVGRANPTWVELLVQDGESYTVMRDALEGLTQGTRVEILRIKTEGVALGESADSTGAPDELEELDPEEVFARCMDTAGIPEEGREELTRGFKEIRQSMVDQDPGAPL